MNSSSGDRADVPEAGRRPSADPPALRLENLFVRFPSTPRGTFVVDGVSIEIRAGEIVGLLGESGSGKTLSGLSLLGLIPYLGGEARADEFSLNGVHLDLSNSRAMKRIRGSAVSMIFQQPRRALNPAYTVGDQLAETIRRHRKVSRKEAWNLAVKALDDVRIPNAAARAHQYPHTLSGGMCQRVVIAIALSCEPSIVVADEPTSALDVTVQKGILSLLRDLCTERQLGVLFVTHDLAVASEMCERISVMYAGQIVESGTVDQMLTRPAHPYTAGLLGSVPRLGTARFDSIPGSPPGLVRPAGCRFHPRCRHAVEGFCDVAIPEMYEVGGRHRSSCMRSDALTLRGIGSADTSS